MTNFEQFTAFCLRHVERQRPQDDWGITCYVDFMGAPEPHYFEMKQVDPNITLHKRAMTAALAAATRAMRPTKLALSSSVWYVTRKDEAGLSLEEAEEKYGPPSEHPDRREALLVVCMDQEISRSYMADIRRTGRRPRLMPWTRTDEGFGPLTDPIREALR